MKAISLKEIRDALRYGDSEGYTLFPELRDQNNIKRVQRHAMTSKMANDLINYADIIVEKKPIQLSFAAFKEFEENGNRLNYEKIYFESKMEIHALVMAEILEGKGKYIKAIEERLWEWCNQYTWELPAHVPLTLEAIKKENIEADEVVALFSAETGFYFAEILSIIGNQLHPLLKYRLKNEIFRRIVEPYKKRFFFWEKVSMNWASVCAGSVGCTALYLMTDANDLSILINRVIGTMESYLLGFDEQGGTTEGLGYWNYGFSFFVYFSELLKDRTAGKIDLLKNDEKIRTVAELPLYLQFPDGGMINFSDAVGDRWEGDYGFLCRLSEVFNIKEYRLPEDVDVFRDHTSKWAIISRNLFWGLGENKSDRQATKTGLFYFPECQWVIDRRKKSTGEFYAFAAKGGHNGEQHNHNDVGHFILHYNGETLLIDLGAPEYTKQYFSEQRYSILNASSMGHSVPVINGKTQVDGQNHYAEVLVTPEDTNLISYKLDLKEAYSIEELDDCTRSFVWDYSQMELTINDSFLFNEAGNSIEEIFITKYPVTVVEEGKVLIQGKNCAAYLLFEESADCKVFLEEISKHSGQKSQIYRICIEYKTKEKEIISTTRIKMFEC